MRDGRKVVLVAGVGTSPAVLTETVWALAHQKSPVIPDEIVVLTTQTGRQKLVREVMTGESSVWSRLVAALKVAKRKVDGKLAFGETSIRVFPDARRNPLADLRSGEDNLRAADFMLAQLRQYTESPDTVVQSGSPKPTARCRRPPSHASWTRSGRGASAW